MIAGLQGVDEKMKPRLEESDCSRIDRFLDLLGVPQGRFLTLRIALG